MNNSISRVVEYTQASLLTMAIVLVSAITWFLWPRPDYRIVTDGKLYRVETHLLGPRYWDIGDYKTHKEARETVDYLRAYNKDRAELKSRKWEVVAK